LPICHRRSFRHQQAGSVVRDVEAVVGPDGWTEWDRLVGQVHPVTVRSWLAVGRLVRLDSGLYATSTVDWRTRVRAVLSRRGGVASHGTALALWGLVPWPGGPVHVSVDPSRSGRGSPGVVLHRGRDVDWHRRRVEGIPVTSVERSIIDTWALPGGIGRPVVRAAAITAVRKRLCSATDLATELARRPTLPGRAALAELVRLLGDGCQSELEIWGCLNVLRGPGMPRFTHQHRVVVRGETFVLDAACEEILLAVEMDGAAWHGARSQRERDIRRDALLATVGWQTLRFGFSRMTAAPDACRRDIRAAYDARRRLFARPRALTVTSDAAN
jgi:very-short-patch-repair endonuclease